MSNFKDGEGVVIIAPELFSSYHIKMGERYQVIVMAGTEVVETAWVSASPPGTANLLGGMTIYCYPNDQFRLHSSSKLYYTHYELHYDVLIKDITGRTVKALTSVEVIRDPTKE